MNYWPDLFARSRVRAFSVRRPKFSGVMTCALEDPTSAVPERANARTRERANRWPQRDSICRSAAEEVDGFYLHHYFVVLIQHLASRANDAPVGPAA
jgi:hypothetical protein